MKKIIFSISIILLLTACMGIYCFAGESVVSDEGRLPFEDVKTEYWYCKSAEFCYANGIIKGMNEYTFAPAVTLTRAQLVTMLANLEGVDTSTYTVDKFTDVKSSHWYYSAVAWAYNEGIVNGMTDTTFQPNGILTRAQLAVVMRNYMEGKYEVEVSDDILDRFTDKPKSEYWYYDAMKYAVSAELLSGNSDGTLAATGHVTRAQAAVIFTSFADKYFYTKCDHFFEEASCTLSERCVYCGMKKGLPNGHTVDSSYSCVTGGICSVCGENVKASKLVHDFAPATCAYPKSCKNCDTTRGSRTNDHKWRKPTCTLDERCTVCNAVRGNSLGHDGTPPTCTTVGKCKRCGVQTAPAKGHSFSDATCTKARYCKRCNIMSGQPLGHDMVNNVCKRCKYTDITDPFDKTVYYLETVGYNSVSNGQIVGKGRWGSGGEVAHNEYVLCNVEYRYADDHIEFSSMCSRTNGENIVFYIYVPKVSGSYRYWTAYYDTNGNVVASAYGSINPGSVYDGMSFTPANYSGRNNLRSDLNYYAKLLLVKTVRGCDEILNKYCDCDIKDFGFKYF